MSAYNFKPKWDTRRMRTVIYIRDSEWGLDIKDRQYFMDDSHWELFNAQLDNDDRMKETRRLNDCITIAVFKEKK